MMKKYILLFLIGILFCSGNLIGQVEFNFSEDSGPVDGTVDIEVSVNGFANISTAQFSGAWDSLIMTFNSVVFTNPALADLTPDNISGPEGADNIDEGQFAFSYNNPFGQATVPDGEVLFTVRFDLVGEECEETVVEISDDPTFIEVTDNLFNVLDVTSDPGLGKIDGPDCNGGGDDLLKIYGDEICIPPGGTLCYPIKVDFFIGVQSGSGTIHWDPTVLEWDTIKNISIIGVNGSLNVQNVDNGELRFVWSNLNPSVPLTLPNGSSLFDINFNVIGSDGDMSDMEMIETGSLGFEWFDDNDDVIPQEVENGKVTISDSKGPPVIVNVSSTSVDEDEDSVCVDFSVENFTNILSMQYVMVWDPTVITNGTPANFNLDLLSSGNFNPTMDAASSATLSWSAAGSGITVTDNTVIYSMCFDLVGECEDVSSVDIVSMGDTDIEFTDGNANAIENYEVNGGTVTIICPVDDCEVTSVDKTCPGELGGNIFVNTASAGCLYSWTNSSGTEVGNSQNLLGVGVGTYSLVVTCNGMLSCSLQDIEVEAFDAMSVSGNVTDLTCTALGSIMVEVTGGSGNYDYNWTPSQPNDPNISDLEAGEYSLVVDDTDTGCSSQSISFTVDPVTSEITINSSIDNESCLGMDGAITVTPSGGCDPYSYAWSDSSIGDTPNATGLVGGSYTVTVTDDNGTTDSASFNVDTDPQMSLNGPAMITPSNGNDGSITINVVGGTEPYSYNWSGPTSGLPNSNVVTGLAPGLYSVIVTDVNGCTLIVTDLEVKIVVVDFTVTDVLAVGDNNGFNLKCFGDTNGSISGSIDGGDVPVVLELTGVEDRTITLNDLGTFVISDLAGGTYNLSLTDNSGSNLTFNVDVTEPDQLEFDLASDDVGCDNGSGDGFIDVMIVGGAGPLSYEWNDADLSGESVDNLSEGSYTVLVTDGNGCEVMEAFTIDPCGISPEPCYEVRDVITPNNDGINDQFLISCVNDEPADLLVFDRWGKQVYEQANYDGTWEGIATDGTVLIEGGYMYILTINFGSGNRQIMKGTLTILR